MKHIWIMLLVLVSFQCATAQELSDAEFDARTQQGIAYIYNLEFEKAEQVFGELAQGRPRHPAGHFFLAMVDWWRIMIDLENRQYDDNFFSSLERVVDLCDELLDEDENNVTALFFKGGALGFEGRLKFHRDDWFAAANAGRSALPLVQDASAADPGNDDIFLGTGIYNYYAEVIPEQYPIAKPLLLFIPPGDKKKGIQELQRAADRGKYAAVEAQYFLMQLYYLYEKEYGKALAIALDLHRRFPNNMVFHKYVGRCYISLANHQMAKQTFTEVSELAQQQKTGYTPAVEREAEYYLGMCEMNARNYDPALDHFYRCDKLSRILDMDGPSGFMVMANLNVGKIYDVKDRRDLAVQQYRKVLEMKEYRDSHAQSDRFLKTPFVH